MRYRIVEEDRGFRLTDSSGQNETYLSYTAAADAMFLWKLEHKHRNNSYEGTPLQRAKIAKKFEILGLTNSRVYDNCFEMGDGELIRKIMETL